MVNCHDPGKRQFNNGSKADKRHSQHTSKTWDLPSEEQRIAVGRKLWPALTLIMLDLEPMHLHGTNTPQNTYG
jgi:hypothetical protein